MRRMAKRHSAACKLTVLLLAWIGIMGPEGSLATDRLSTSQARALAQEAYIYFYPLVLMDVSRLMETSAATDNGEVTSSANKFSHQQLFPSPPIGEAIRPNFDTVYSVAWLDLMAEPVIVSMPDTGGRYYLLSMFDMWSEAFATPGTRTTGTSATKFVVVPPNWAGRVVGLPRIDAPTPYVWVLGEIRTNGPSDYQAVRQIEEGMAIYPVSQIGRRIPRPVSVAFDPSVDRTAPARERVGAMSAKQYFAYGAQLLKTNPPRETDWSILARLKQMGIEQGKDFDVNNTDPIVREALENTATASLKLITGEALTLAPMIDGCHIDVDTAAYANDYLKRAGVAMRGVGLRQPQEAICRMIIDDADGKPLNGGNRYIVHFDKEMLPPVDGSWSLTVYDAEGHPANNSIGRFVIGDRDKLEYNPDSSLDIWIQYQDPGPSQRSNWLPIPPTEGLEIILRLYAPHAEVIDGRWIPPPIARENGREKLRN